jgi:hypothetical protein
MTQFFLVYNKERDEYLIRTIGLGHRFQVIKRKEDMTDEQFKEEAIRQFDTMVSQDQIISGELVKTDYVF